MEGRISYPLREGAPEGDKKRLTVGRRKNLLRVILGDSLQSVFRKVDIPVLGPVLFDLI